MGVMRGETAPNLPCTPAPHHGQGVFLGKTALRWCAVAGGLQWEQLWSGSGEWGGCRF